MDVPRILIADDDYDDHSILLDAFTDLGYADSIKIMEGGQPLIDYLQVTGENVIKLIVLDLNMPRLSGAETLELLKKNAQFQNIPVVIFSTSANEAEKKACMVLGAAEFIEKPRFVSEYKRICVKLYMMAYHPTLY